MKHGLLIAALVAAVSTGCAQPVRSGALIDRYGRAECVPVRFGPGIQPSSRVWDHTLKIREGIDVHVSGAQVPGGRIDVRFTPGDEEDVAADAGDYIYPSDLRFDGSRSLLYIKANGAPAAFGGPQTWLFEYDLRQRRQTGRLLVDPQVLPQQCPETR